MHLRNGCVRKATRGHQEVVRKAGVVGNKDVRDSKARLVSVVPHVGGEGNKPDAGRQEEERPLQRDKPHCVGRQEQRHEEDVRKEQEAQAAQLASRIDRRCTGVCTGRGTGSRTGEHFRRATAGTSETLDDTRGAPLARSTLKTRPANTSAHAVKTCASERAANVMNDIPSSKAVSASTLLISSAEVLRDGTSSPLTALPLGGETMREGLTGIGCASMEGALLSGPLPRRRAVAPSAIGASKYYYDLRAAALCSQTPSPRMALLESILAIFLLGCC